MIQLKRLFSEVEAVETSDCIVDLPQGARLLVQLKCTPTAIVQVQLKRLTPAQIEPPRPQKTSKLAQAAYQQLVAYAQGKLQVFDLPLAAVGTEFQHQVWQALLQIPYAHKVSYQSLAQAVGCPQGARAIGQANGRNPWPLLVPCHRVIRADGSLGGYSGGLEIKKYLLAHESQMAHPG
ncbi:methylated-DNA-[protein]-cysteine S-methyltransferase [Allopseudospirillum japonicum]|uniref:methylated-DNA--[protein]-cysteine S-methyltransferase n=1 Tax=Allopseudospirillum japonicum TaxID=64971 RepID=A0A1H6UF98_9GAMM|nr:methylated-DNA--[protein]-cysteine S-methyltransferase [Allopseudospirillum japonicum]SEI90999.1 methylated-DNA-[protein]-cysteine S-methyltransferase [Allopseudospirillum japonicum]